LVSLLFAAGARMLEVASRGFRSPTRFLWLAALLLTAGLAAIAPLRTSAPEISATETVYTPEEGDASTVASYSQPSLSDRAIKTIRQLRDWPMTLLASRTGEKIGPVAGMIWLLLTLILFSVGVITLGRYHYLRKRWPVVNVSGCEARLTPDRGPALIGVIRPEIVVPEWLLNASDEERKLVVMHELEHLRARDPMVLILGCLIVALIPWNPVVWWMLYRLRLCIELDCDARVLNKGALPRSYGSMLLDVAGRNSGLLHGVPAFSGSPSILKQRLLAMTTNTKQTPAALTVLFTVFSASLLFFACDSTMITDAQTIEELHETVTERSNSDNSLTVRGYGGEEDPLIVIDGEIMADFDLSGISPKDIESISVLKGEAAEDKYKDDGKNGVIEIKLKSEVETEVETETEIEVEES
ncbi:MAG: M56 family metallopeptidase, partial [Balneolaceae bacterium]